MRVFDWHASIPETQASQPGQQGIMAPTNLHQQASASGATWGEVTDRSRPTTADSDSAWPCKWPSDATAVTQSQSGPSSMPPAHGSAPPAWPTTSARPDSDRSFSRKWQSRPIPMAPRQAQPIWPPAAAADLIRPTLADELASVQLSESSPDLPGGLQQSSPDRAGSSSPSEGKPLDPTHRAQPAAQPVQASSQPASLHVAHQADRWQAGAQVLVGSVPEKAATRGRKPLRAAAAPPPAPAAPAIAAAVAAVPDSMPAPVPHSGMGTLFSRSIHHLHAWLPCPCITIVAAFMTSLQDFYLHAPVCSPVIESSLDPDSASSLRCFAISYGLCPAEPDVRPGSGSPAAAPRQRSGPFRPIAFDLETTGAADHSPQGAILARGGYYAGVKLTT